MKVYAFHCGGDQADLAINDPLDENVGQKQYSPYFFYMIVHPKGRVLFDTGLHPEIRTNFARRMGVAAGAFPIEMFEDGDVVGQLAKLGLGPGDIDAVVPSHLHFDHAGGLEFVRHAPVYVQAVEISTARTPPAEQTYDASSACEPGASLCNSATSGCSVKGSVDVHPDSTSEE